MGTEDILRRLAALADPENDDTQWLTALAATVREYGIVDDEDPISTGEAVDETRRIALEIRELASAAREILPPESARSAAEEPCSEGVNT